MISLEKNILFAIFIHVTSGCECVKICFNHIHYLFITYLFIRTAIQKENFLCHRSNVRNPSLRL